MASIDDTKKGYEGDEEDTMRDQTRRGLVSDGELDKCRLVAFVTDHLFECVDEQMLEAFQSYLKCPDARLFRREAVDSDFVDPKPGTDYIFSPLAGGPITFAVRGQCVSVSGVEVSC